MRSLIVTAAALIAAVIPTMALVDGRPYAWCGWYARHYLTHHDPGPSFNLASNWTHWGSPSHPRPGAIVVWPHHVGKIVGGPNPWGQWLVTSGNDGHAVKTRYRYLHGAIAFRSEQGDFNAPHYAQAPTPAPARYRVASVETKPYHRHSRQHIVHVAAAKKLEAVDLAYLYRNNKLVATSLDEVFDQPLHHQQLVRPATVRVVSHMPQPPQRVTYNPYTRQYTLAQPGGLIAYR